MEHGIQVPRDFVPPRSMDCRNGYSFGTKSSGWIGRSIEDRQGFCERP
jgi:hypothetical protein